MLREPPSLPDAVLTFRALADPTRQALLALLAHGPRAATDLAAEVGQSRVSVSKHLSVLEAGGLVSSTRRGRQRLNRLNPAGFAAALGWIDRYAGFWAAQAAALDRPAA